MEKGEIIRIDNIRMYNSSKNETIYFNFNDVLSKLNLTRDQADEKILNLYIYKIENEEYLNEPGFYLLSFMSNTEEAKIFKEKLASIIIPTIRITGMFVSQKIIDKIENNETTLEAVYEESKKVKQEKEREYLKLKNENTLLEKENKLLMEEYKDGYYELKDLCKMTFIKLCQKHDISSDDFKFNVYIFFNALLRSGWAKMTQFREENGMYSIIITPGKLVSEYIIETNSYYEENDFKEIININKNDESGRFGNKAFSLKMTNYITDTLLDYISIYDLEYTGDNENYYQSLLTDQSIYEDILNKYMNIKNDKVIFNFDEEWKPYL